MLKNKNILQMTGIIGTLLILCVFLEAQEAPDKVWMKDRAKPYRGWIAGEDYKELRLKITQAETGTVLKLKQNEIRSVEYGNATQEFKNGIQAYKTGNYERALDNFNKAPANNAWASMYLDYYKADCLIKLGKTENGIEKLKDVANDTSSKFFVTARRTLADVMKKQKNYDQAIDHYNKLASNMLLDDKWRNQAKFDIYKCYFYKQDDTSVDRALREMQELSIRVSDENLKKNIELFKVKIHLSKNNFSHAETRLKELAKKYTGAIITNGFGDIYFAKENYNAARYNYLKTVVLSSTDKDEYIRALYRAGLCFDKLKNIDKTGNQRAVQLYRETIAKGSGTEWADKAQKRLGDLGQAK